MSNDNSIRTLIAFLVIGAGILSLTIVSWVAVSNSADAATKTETVRLVFASIVPLVGTWVGAVLAFYFSAANLRAGSDTAIAAVQSANRIGPETPVTAAMTRLARINPIAQVTDDAAARALPLVSLVTSMTKAGQSRVPILNNGGAALYVVHASDIDKFANSQSTPVAAKDLPPAATLGDLINTVGFPQLLTFAVVDESATLADARAALSAIGEAKDVFITTDGRRTGAVTGWLTNSDLARAT